MKITISPDWTPEERIKAASCLIRKIQDDIYNGEYALHDNPSLTSVQVILNAPKEDLELDRDSLEKMLAQL